MDETIRLLGVAMDAVRTLFSVVLVAGAAGAAAAWAERTRRVDAFGGVARFARQVMDPLIAPFEGRIVQIGGSRTSAPWWWLFAILVAGALLIGVLAFVRGELAGIYYASRGGVRGLLRFAIGWGFTVLQLAVLARVILSWVGGTYTKFGRLVWWLTEWMLEPLRRVLPTIGMVDISPLVAWFALGFLQGLVLRAL
jgi:YggT family protein